MGDTSDFTDHWLQLDAEELEHAERMYQWNPASMPFYEPAGVAEGHAVADFGCGPGHQALEFARWVGPSGHVHALDINADFVARAREKAQRAGLGERITAHRLVDARLPLPDHGLDRVITRNTIIYVPDPVFTYREFLRVLRPGGIAHAIEGDWMLTAVEPVPPGEWGAVVEAASWAWREPRMGRKLYHVARRAGFEQVSLQVVTLPDTEGRLRGMIETIAGYARRAGTLGDERIDAVVETARRAMDEGTYLAISPQFLVTAVAP